MRLDREAEEAVLATLDRYAERYGAKDVDGVTELFADDPDVVLIGTGADERWVGRREIRRQFARNFAEAERTHFEWVSQHVAAAGNGAWVAADAIVHVVVEGVERSIPIRFTVVLEQRDGVWVWLHRHASVAAGGQSSGTAYPVTTEHD
ncbi:MAG TPA: nuclear transport factor 2 family protein [Gaiellaceae bacterium]|nr:nuclear transport factor 2 family protein [Gaiellaceae bacterium]